MVWRRLLRVCRGRESEWTLRSSTTEGWYSPTPELRRVGSLCTIQSTTGREDWQFLRGPRERADICSGGVVIPLPFSSPLQLLEPTTGQIHLTGGLWSVDPAKYTLRGAVDPAKYTLRGAVDPAKYTLRGAVDTAKYTLREAVDPDQNLKVLNRGWEIYIQYVPQLLQGLYINPELLTKFIKLPTIYKIGQTLLDSQYLYSFQCSQFSSVYAQYEENKDKLSISIKYKYTFICYFYV